MPDQDATTGAQVNPQTGAGAGHDASGMIPKARFDEVNTRMKSAEATLAQLQRAAEDRERADLEAKGKYDELRQKLEQERDSLKGDAEAWRLYHAQRRETLLAGLSDEDKPLADGLPLDKLEALAERLKKTGVGTPPTPPSVPGAAVPAGQKLTPEQVREGVRTGGQKWLRDNWNLMR